MGADMKKCVWLAMSLAVLLAGCDAARQVLAGMQKPSASLNGLSFGDITLDSATLLFDVEITNPYSVDLPLLNMDYAVASGQNKLFSGKADVASTIPANGSKVVALPATITYADLLKAFKGIRPGTSIPYSADLGLSFKAPAVGNVRVPLNRTGELTVPSMPGIDSIDWREMLLK